ncbi:hypothetical protein [Caenimonas aquaedulcis]|uniref:Uncharacterized protein n=1 Tax=Caenimonas aquaedulcis TaxID=2793270 RepID=A0A931MHS7_9BURK|nr:hypothetical protein [Caenimonas aquaedulcis]MBG9388475.1 hypothetical protein [Caenimonas aquaedulcis]
MQQDVTRGSMVMGVLALALAGCGGGGGGTDSPAAAAVSAPSSSTSSPSASPGTSTQAASTTPAAQLPTASTTPSGALAAAPMLADCELFPASAIFNTRIDDTSRFPVHAQSATWKNLVGTSVPFSTDWGVNDNPASYSTYWGMPVNIIDGSAATTDWPVVSYDFSTSGVSMERGYPDKSDCATVGGDGYAITRPCGAVPTGQRRFPFPLSSRVLNEDGNCNDPNTCGDRHLLVVEKGACRLWEAYFAYQLSGQWYAMATAAWDMKSLSLRPDDWAAGDAAGLPITPLLAKAAEASSGEIRHALRVNFSDAKLSLEHVWPARFASGWDNPGAIPFGSLLRLRADFVIPDDWTTQAKALATAAKRYGLYVTDNGADFFVQGEPNAAWDLRTNAQMRNITMADMEFVDLKSVTSDPRFSKDSMAASW